MSQFKTDNTRILKMLTASYTAKQKAGWSRFVGAKFIADDIMKIRFLANGFLRFVFGWGAQEMLVRELNLRETEEAIRYMGRLNDTALNARIAEWHGRMEHV